MKVAFTDTSFAFEFVRNLGFMYYGGSDLGEMIATAGQIKEGDFESWFTEWDTLARRIPSRADTSLSAGHLGSLGPNLSSTVDMTRASRSFSFSVRRGSATRL